jgi:hypothetical protein
MAIAIRDSFRLLRKNVPGSLYFRGLPAAYLDYDEKEVNFDFWD